MLGGFTFLLRVWVVIFPALALGAESGLERLSRLARDPMSLPEETRIEELSIGLRQTVNRNVYRVGDADKVHAELKECLLNLGGCSSYYREKINNAWKILEAETNPALIGPLKVKLTNCQQEGFGTLALLPEPSTVGVLGEFLFDERGRLERLPSQTKDEWSARQYKTTIGSNSNYALRAIAKLPIISPPVPRRLGSATIYEQDIETWRLWYEQVRAGTRTFRFEGDPQVYSLKGPVGRVAIPDSADITARPKAEVSLEAPMDAGPPSSPPAVEAAKATWWPLWAALVVLGAGLGSYLRKRSH